MGVEKDEFLKKLLKGSKNKSSIAIFLYKSFFRIF